jgi:hypothetical protein
MNLAHNAKASPLSLAPDIWWSEDRWTIGFTHSNASVDRLEPGGSLCVRTDLLYCDSVYRGSGLDARYAVTDWISPRARFLVRDIEPFKPAVTLGAAIERAYGRWEISADPYLQLGLANRGDGNRAAIWLPVAFTAAVSRFDFTLHTGWNSELAILRDGWHIPLALGASADVDDHFELGATVGFASMLGPQNTPKQRVLFVTLSWEE